MSFQSEIRCAGSEVGDNPRISQAGQADYRRLRDLRSAARDDERKQEVQDRSDRHLRVAPQWTEIAELATKLIREIGKDIEVAIWLIEAETRLNGHAGMVNAVALLTDMVTVYGRMLHPHSEDADDRPFDMISSLNGAGREGTLIQPLRLLPLVPDVPYGEACLWSTQAGAEAETAAALASAGPDAVREKLSDILAAQTAIEACDKALTELLGREAPPFSQIQEILEDSEAVLRRLADLGEAPEEAEPASESPVVETPSEVTAQTSAGAIRSREDAFEHLLRIARFFRHAEPHSPIADTLETLVRRGRMDFLTLIEELIPDPNARQAVMTSAGIGKTKPGNTGAN
ncbi:type VI secretion system protein TssA [Roseobacter weihaiensis]|uniref:type VI secretion system protein TssA n=1 Tax=Roseobacter weihaiensis TaxID=2763262 RepID=UPI001D0BACB9|nr:type VI secretion system ImpA family N-terminal domain-containing protein [Roseobacter sp. H9]